MSNIFPNMEILVGGPGDLKIQITVCDLGGTQNFYKFRVRPSTRVGIGVIEMSGRKRIRIMQQKSTPIRRPLESILNLMPQFDIVKTLAPHSWFVDISAGGINQRQFAFVSCSPCTIIPE